MRICMQFQFYLFSPCALLNHHYETELLVPCDERTMAFEVERRSKIRKSQQLCFVTYYYFIFFNINISAFGNRKSDGDSEFGQEKLQTDVAATAMNIYVKKGNVDVGSNEFIFRLNLFDNDHPVISIVSWAC
ncbi:hypothetical protein Tsp_04444 [Trichinella spiralis]|uniref:hypothetical protein n=1 Tax=Trichinella spiralis TaxID=6334 RepID=UPI0001EFEAF6|nr:hypothetical protein Tsp_04444 [Trichinella spiralis]